VTALDQLFASRIATIVPEAVGPTLAAELRTRLDRAGYNAPRAGSTAAATRSRSTPEEPVVLAALAGLAGAGDRPVARGWSTRSALRLGPGMTTCSHTHDRSHEDPLVELMLDLSPASVPGADVHYRRHGQVVFQVASRPGALSGRRARPGDGLLSRLRQQAPRRRVCRAARGAAPRRLTRGGRRPAAAPRARGEVLLSQRSFGLANRQ